MATLVGKKARNHPQQVEANGADDDADDRRTPTSIFALLDAEHHFTIDVAASEENTKCDRFFTKKNSGLKHSWSGDVVWCNPPYSDILPWVHKARSEVAYGDCQKVVMLLPANRTEQPFWQELIEPVRDRGKGMRTQFLPGRPRFGTSANPDGLWNSSCPFGVVAIIFERPTQANAIGEKP